MKGGGAEIQASRGGLGPGEIQGSLEGDEGKQMGDDMPIRCRTGRRQEMNWAKVALKNYKQNNMKCPWAYGEG
jgi:hypothetical protein